MVKYCVFENCSADWGGGIYVEKCFYATISNTAFYYCSAKEKGADIYVYKLDSNSDVSEVSCPNSYTTHEDNTCYITNSYYANLKLMDMNQVVRSGGTFAVNCGFSYETACYSVNGAIHNRRPRYPKNIFMYEGQYYETEPWSITESSQMGNVVVWGCGYGGVFNLNNYNGSMVNIEGRVSADLKCFAVNINRNNIPCIRGYGGSFILTLVEVKYSMGGGYESSINSIFEFSTGSVSFVRVIMESIRISAHYIFKLDQSVTGLALNNSNFTNIVSTQNCSAIFISNSLYPKTLSISGCQFTLAAKKSVANTLGGVFFSTSDNCNVNISSTNFTSCSVNEASGKGGAIYYSTTGALSHLKISRCQFLSNKARYGRDVFIFVPKLPEANLNALYTPAISSEPTYNRTNAWYGSDNATFKGDFDLMPFIFGYTSTTVHASNASRGDGIFCGSTFAHCKSINQAVQRLSSGSSRTIYVGNSIEVTQFGVNITNVILRRNDSSSSAAVISKGNVQSNSKSIFVSNNNFKSIKISYSFDATLASKAVTCLLNVTNGSQSFENCTFQCDLSITFPISLVDITNGMLSFTNSSFNSLGVLKCSRSLFVLDAGNISISRSSFCNLTFASTSTGVFSQSGINSLNQNVNISSSNFTSVCSDKRTSSCFALLSETSSGSFDAYNCRFQNSSCPNSVDGGAISFAVGAGKSYRMTLCTVQSNTASSSVGKGGGALLVLKENTNNFVFDRCTFEDNGARYGRDIYIKALNLKASVSFEKFGDMLTPTTDVNNKLFGCNIENEDVHLDLIPLMITHLSNVFVKNSEADKGIDWFQCGNSSNPCLTLEYGINEILDRNNETITISIEKQAVISQTIDLSNLTISSTTDGTNSSLMFQLPNNVMETVITNSDGLKFNEMRILLPLAQNLQSSLFTASSDLLFRKTFFEQNESDVQISYCIVNIIKGAVSFERCVIGSEELFSKKSLFQLSASTTISMNECQVKNIISKCPIFPKIPERSTIKLNSSEFLRCEASSEEASSALISSTLAGSVLMIGCNFSDIRSSNDQNGGAVNIALNEGGMLTVERCIAQNCICNEVSGRGGFLFLSKRQSSGDFDFLEASRYFDNKAFVGRNLFFEFDSLNSSVSAAKIRLEEDGTECFGSNAYVGCDSVFESIDLIMFLVQYSSETLHISEYGYDVLNCGFEEFPCHTLLMGLENIPEDSTEKKIITHSRVDVGSHFDLCNISFVAFGSETPQLNINSSLSSGNEFSTFTADWLCSFASIDFLLPTRFTTNIQSVILISSSEAITRLTDCSFKKASDDSGPLLFSLVISSDGRLEMTSCTLKDISFSNNPFSLSQINLHTFNRCNFSSIVFRACSLIDSPTAAFQSYQHNSASSGIHFLNCSFEKLSADSGTTISTLMNFPLSSSFELVGCSVNGLLSHMCTEGGGMKVSLNEGSSLKVAGNSAESPSAIESSSCSTTFGKGGFCYLSAQGNNTDFAFADTTFADNAAYQGMNLFLRCDVLLAAVKLEKFAFSFEDWLDEGNAFVGMDSLNFTYEPINLLIFLVHYESDTIFVSSLHGFDVNSCGTSQLPCSSMLQGIEHFTDTQTKTMFVVEAMKITSALELSGYTIQGEENAGYSTVTFESPLLSPSSQVSNESVLQSSSNLALHALSIAVPCEFSSGQTQLIQSTGPSSSLTIDSCAFERASDSSEQIAVKLVVVRGGKATFNEITIKNQAFSKSLFELDPAVDSFFDYFSLSNVAFTSSVSLISFIRSPIEQSESTESRANEKMQCVLQNITAINVSTSGESALSVFIRDPVAFPLSIKDCSVNTIQSLESNEGGFFRVHLEENGSFAVSILEMVRCECSVEVGKGGGLFIECSEGSNENFQLDEIYCASNAAHVARDVYLSCSSLSAYVNESSFGWGSLFADKSNSLMGSDATTPEGEFTDLFIFFQGFEDFTIFISDAGSNGVYCGQSSNPCLTLDYSVRHLKFAEDVTVRMLFVQNKAVITGNFPLNSVILRPTSEDRESTVVFPSEVELKNPESVMKVQNQVNLSHLNFDIPLLFSYATPNSFINSAELEGSLNVSSCNFNFFNSVANPISSSSSSSSSSKSESSFNSKTDNDRTVSNKMILFSVIRGGLIIESVTISPLQTCVSLFSLSQAVPAALSNFSLTTINLTSSSPSFSLISYASGVFASTSRRNDDSFYQKYSNCTFSSVTRLDDSASTSQSSYHQSSLLINVMTAVPFTFENCTFTSFEAPTCASGGCLGVTLLEGGSIRIKPAEEYQTNAMNCRCDEKSGKGGFLYLDTSRQNENFILQSVFFRENKAKEGKNVFVNGFDLNASITYASFNFAYDDPYADEADSTLFMGKDTKNFATAISLLMFLEEWKGAHLYLSSETGKDIRGCGMKKLPCSTLAVGMEHFSEADARVSSELLKQKRNFEGKENSEPSRSVLATGKFNCSSILNLTDTLFCETAFDPRSTRAPTKALFNYSSLLTHPETPDEPSNEEADGSNAAVINEGKLSVYAIEFVLPSAFENGLNTFVSSSNGELSLKYCTFSAIANGEECNYLVISAFSGSVEINRCETFFTKFTQSIFKVSSDVQKIVLSSLQLDEVTLTNGCVIEWATADPASKTRNTGRNRDYLKNQHELNGFVPVNVENCTFQKVVRGSTDGSAALSMGDFSLADMKITNSSFSECSSPSLKGGVFRLLLAEQDQQSNTIDDGESNTINSGKLIVSQCTFTLCSCDAANGYGGALFIDCVMNKSKEPELYTLPELPLFFSELRFTHNSAQYGRDIFIVCYSVEKQISENLFSMDFSSHSFVRDKAIFGEDISKKIAGEENFLIDLYEIIVFFKGSQIYLSSTLGTDMRVCGSDVEPCKSLSLGVQHLNNSRFQYLFVYEKTEIGGEVYLDGVSLQPAENSSSAELVLDQPAVQIGSNENLINTRNTVGLDRLNVRIETDVINHYTIISQNNGTLSISSCSFSGIKDNKLDANLLQVEEGTLQVQETSFENLSLFQHVLSADPTASSITFLKSNFSSIGTENSFIYVTGIKSLRCEEVLFTNVLVGNNSLVSSDSVEVVQMKNITLSKCNGTSSLFAVSNTVFSMENVVAKSIEARTIFHFHNVLGSITLDRLNIKEVALEEGGSILRAASSFAQVSKSYMNEEESQNITLSYSNISKVAYKQSSVGCILDLNGSSNLAVSMTGCSITNCSVPSEGRICRLENVKKAQFEFCSFAGNAAAEQTKTNTKLNERNEIEEQICFWDGCAVEFSNSKVSLKDSSFTNFGAGGVKIMQCDVHIEMGMFANNNPSISGYPSVRHNVICSDSGTLNIESLKGGDGQEKDTSLWILNEGCTLTGIPAQRASPLFIPSLYSVAVEESAGNTIFTFNGSLFLPCNLTSSLVVNTYSEGNNISETKVTKLNLNLINETTAKATDSTFHKESLEPNQEAIIVLSLKDANGREKQVSSVTIKEKEPASRTETEIKERTVQSSSTISIWMILFIVIAVVAVVGVLVVVVVVLTLRKRKNSFHEISFDDDSSNMSKKQAKQLDQEMELSHGGISGESLVADEECTDYTGYGKRGKRDDSQTLCVEVISPLAESETKSYSSSEQAEKENGGIEGHKVNFDLIDPIGSGMASTANLLENAESVIDVDSFLLVQNEGKRDIEGNANKQQASDEEGLLPSASLNISEKYPGSFRQFNDIQTEQLRFAESIFSSTSSSSASQESQQTPSSSDISSKLDSTVSTFSTPSFNPPPANDDIPTDMLAVADEHEEDSNEGVKAEKKKKKKKKEKKEKKEKKSKSGGKKGKLSDDDTLMQNVQPTEEEDKEEKKEDITKQERLSPEAEEEREVFNEIMNGNFIDELIGGGEEEKLPEEEKVEEEGKKKKKRKKKKKKAADKKEEDEDMQNFIDSLLEG